MSKARLISAASLTTLMMAGPALAQETSPTAPAPSTVGPTTQPQTDTAAAQVEPQSQLSDIVVTAQRRSENLQRAAVPVDVVSAADLIRSGATSPTGLGALVPALVATPAGGARTNFFVRGVGNFTSNPLFDSAVAINFDNVYIGRPGSTSGLFYDLERLEVLKGPQGTLYGRNATGGAINVLPVHPKPGVFSGYATASYGNYDALMSEGAVNVPFGERGAMRVSGTYTRHDGYLSDGTSDEKTGAFRVQLLGELNPALTVRTSFDYAHVGGRGAGVNYANAYFYNAALGSYVVRPGQAAGVGLYDPAAQSFRATLRAGPAGRNLDNLAPIAYIRNDFYGANAELTYDTGAGVLTIIPAWRRSDQTNLSDTFGFSAWIGEKDEQQSVEARFAGTRVGPIDYTLGALYFHETNDGRFAIGQSAIANFQDVHQRTNSLAGFARVTAHLTDAFRVVGGVRYTRDRKSFAGTADRLTLVCAAPACPTVPLLPQVTYPADLPAPFVVPPPGAVRPVGTTGAILVRAPIVTVTARQPKDRFTYRAAVELDVGARSLLYGSVETGFRSGGFSLATGYETYQPEYITAFTLGSKNRFFDNRLQLNLEGFYWKYRNQQLATVTLDRAGLQGNFTQNIGRSEIYGVDAETRLLVTPTTIANAQVQWLHTEYKRFTYQVPGVNGAPPFTGCATSLTAAGSNLFNVNCSGKPAYNSPRWTVNLGGEQTLNLGDYKAVVSVDTQYRSGRFVGFEFQPAQRVGETWTTNAQLTVGPRDDAWSIGAFVRNIENNRYPVQANTFAIGSALVTITSPPRTYGVRGSVKF